MKQKAKWAAIENGDHNASITKYTEKKQKKNRKSYKEQEQQHQYHRLRTVSRKKNYRRTGGGGGGGGGGAGGSGGDRGEGGRAKALLQLSNLILGPDATLNTEIHKNSVRIKAPNSVDASKRNIQIKLTTMINKDGYS